MLRELTHIAMPSTDGQTTSAAMPAAAARGFAAALPLLFTILGIDQEKAQPP
jgi:hypothetical protein